MISPGYLTAHSLQNVEESSVSLDRVRPEIFHPDPSPCDRRRRKEVGGVGGITFHKVFPGGRYLCRSAQGKTGLRYFELRRRRRTSHPG